MSAFQSGRGTIVAAMFAVALAACGDETGPVMKVRPPGNAYVAADSIMESVGKHEGFFVTLDLASRVLWDTESGAELSLDRAPSAQVLPGALAAKLVAMDPARGALIPGTAKGKTYVFDPEQGKYVVDPTRPGAPTSGARFIHYAIDIFRRVPSTPLIELGYLDLTDESTLSGPRITVRLRSDSDTLVDYTLGVTSRVSGSEEEVTVGAEGYLFDGELRLDLDLRETVTRIQGADGYNIAVDYTLAIAGSGQESSSLRLEATEASSSWENGMELTVTARAGNDVVVLEAGISGQTIEGQVTRGDRQVALIRGSSTSPQFDHPDGGEFTQQELSELRTIWSAAAQLVGFAHSIFTPIMEFAS